MTCRFGTPQKGSERAGEFIGPNRVVVPTLASRLLYRDGRGKTGSGSSMKNQLLRHHAFSAASSGSSSIPRILQTTCRT